MQFYDDFTLEIDELRANVDYVKQRSKAIADLLDTLHDFSENVSKFGVSPVKYHALVEHLSEELLGSETELQILENDLAKERFLANE